MHPRRSIFFQYRGPSREEDEFPRDRQLENNLTKAFIDLLHHTAPHAGFAALFSLLQNQPQTRSLIARLRHDTVELGMQSVPPEAASAPRRAVLLITAKGTPTVREGEPSGNKGRPDAWLRANGDGSTLLIEAKLGTWVSPQQIAGHLRAARWGPPVPVARVTWEDLYDVLHEMWSTQRLSPVDRFLFDQFLEYLEVIGVAPFTGFQRSDFDFFLHHEAEYRPRLRQKMQQFAELVHPQLDKDLRAKYSQIRVGNIHADTERGAWAIFWSTKADRFAHCNLNIEINRDRLEFNAVIRDGRTADPNSPIGHFSRRLRAAPQTFEEIMAGLGTNYGISVYSRTRRGGTVPPRQGDERWHLVGMQRLEFVGEGLVNWLRSLLQVIPFPGVLIGRHVPRGDPILLEIKKLKAEAVRSLEDVSAVLRFLQG